MGNGFHHLPVLLAETLTALNIRAGGTYVDATVGGAGHSLEICRRLGAGGRLFALDQDPAALAAAGERLQGCDADVQLLRGNFAQLDAHLRPFGVTAVDGILMDIGVSSHQLDTPDRGFSYQHEAPLDMRMDPDQPETAASLLQHLPEAELVRILFEYGEERYARRIAGAIVRSREQRPLRTTGELADLVRSAMPAVARREPQHPARRTFQALRIAVNAELDRLSQALAVALPLLNPGGRLAVITFHSLEDRIVKQTFNGWAKGCTCPPRLPMCVCGKSPQVRIPGRKPVCSSEAEIAANPRARSAKLRFVERLAPGAS